MRPHNIRTVQKFSTPIKTQQPDELVGWHHIWVLIPHRHNLSNTKKVGSTSQSHLQGDYKIPIPTQPDLLQKK